MAAIVIATIWWSLGHRDDPVSGRASGHLERHLRGRRAGQCDAASKAFWYITLPNLKRTITLVIVLQIILHFQVFGQSHLMTQGGPNDTTQVLVRYIYQTGIPRQRTGPRQRHGRLPVRHHGRVLGHPVHRRTGERRDEPQLLLAGPRRFRSRPFSGWCRRLWMVSLSFQPNEVLARTTSSTALRADPDPVHGGKLRRALCLRADALVVPELADRRGRHDAWACSPSRPRRATRWRGSISRSRRRSWSSA